MNPQTQERARRLFTKGFGKTDISRLLGATYSELRYAVDDAEGGELVRREGQRLLKRVPAWWKDTPERYREVVLANFGESPGFAGEK